jgi:hypothetical protein
VDFNTNNGNVSQSLFVGKNKEKVIIDLNKNFRGKKKFKNVRDIMSSKKKEKLIPDVPNPASGASGLVESVMVHKKANAKHEQFLSAEKFQKVVKTIPFRLDPEYMMQEFEYFKYLESRYFMLYFEVFKECVKNNFDIFRYLNQKKVIIKMSLLDLSKENYRRTRLQMQKLKTRYPFIQLILDVDEQILTNPDLMKLFTAENICGFNFFGVNFIRKKSTGKFTVVNKDVLKFVIDFIEKNYLIIFDIDDPKDEHEKFLYLDVLRKNILDR